MVCESWGVGCMRKTETRRNLSTGTKLHVNSAKNYQTHNDSKQILTVTDLGCTFTFLQDQFLLLVRYHIQGLQHPFFHVLKINIVIYVYNTTPTVWAKIVRSISVVSEEKLVINRLLMTNPHFNFKYTEKIDQQ